MTGDALHAARNARFGPHGRLGFIVAAIAAVFMTLTEALGTGVVPFGLRLVYWLIVMLTGAAIGSGVTAAIHDWGRLRRYPVLEVAAIAVSISAPLTLAVIGAGMMLLGMRRPSIEGLVMNFGLVVTVSMAITGIVHAIARSRAEDGAAAPVPVAVPGVPDTRFRDRLPIQFQTATILALESEDHYLRVHLDTGSTLILHRLSDAIAELSTLDGQQTHRSWWVARAAVASAKRTDGKHVLTLSNDVEVPVSRTYARDLTAAGWLA